jgi:HD-GYP domain-containing protein (c-di-GMP phosphodiesterase class II)
MSRIKEIPIERLRPGMYVIHLDQPWYKTPFLSHKRLIKSHQEIVLLRQLGVQRLSIDPTKGVDVGDQPDERPFDNAPEEAALPPKPANFEENRSGQSSGETADSAALPAPDVILTKASAAVERIFNGIEQGSILSIQEAKQVVEPVFRRIQRDRQSLLTELFLRQLRRFDRNLAEHAIDVSALALIFAVENEAGEEQSDDIGLGALLHDVGYLRLPRNLYRKGDNLTAQERELRQRHTELGLLLVQAKEDIHEPVRRIIADHHERTDGSGFPRGLDGSKLSRATQFVALADVYDNLSGRRPGRPALLPHEVIRQLFLLGEQQQFEKSVIEVAIRSLGVYPVGSLVKLSTGETGVVVAVNPLQRLKPVIKLVSGPKGEIHADPVLLDLAAEPSGSPKRTILRVLDPLQEHVNVAMYLNQVKEAA